jgi:hypothetical protein
MRRSRWIGWEVGVVAGGGTSPMVVRFQEEASVKI